LIGRNPVAVRLRYRQTFVEISPEKFHHNFSIPIDTIAHFPKGLTQK
jgi:hypothetical protein